LAARYVDAELPTATPATPMAEAAELLDHLHEPRLVVLDRDGMKLRGLLCFNRSSSRFCVE
jgi:CBS domain-containing protein